VANLTEEYTPARYTLSLSNVTWFIAKWHYLLITPPAWTATPLCIQSDHHQLMLRPCE